MVGWFCFCVRTSYSVVASFCSIDEDYCLHNILQPREAREGNMLGKKLVHSTPILHNTNSLLIKNNTLYQGVPLFRNHKFILTFSPDNCK